MCSSSFCFTLLQKPVVEGLMQWFSSTAARVAQLEESNCTLIQKRCALLKSVFAYAFINQGL